MRSKAIHTLLTMMMVATIILVWTRATAEMLVVEHAYELNADQVALPAHENALVTIRTCPNCDARVLRADSGTRYFAGFSNRRPLSHRAFMETVAPTLDDDSAVYVFYRANTTTVTRIVAGGSSDSDD